MPVVGVKLCECGCGEPAPIAKQTNRPQGRVKGQPMRFIRGHHNHLLRTTGDGPNPGGLCMCGCGGRAPIARHSNSTLGWVRGKPKRFINRHGPRKPAPADYVVDENGCWIWQRSTDRNGYGRLRRNGEASAHRVYYIERVGPIPAGHHLHHTCEVKACVNPAHLEPLTKAEHERRHVEARARAA